MARTPGARPQATKARAPRPKAQPAVVSSASPVAKAAAVEAPKKPFSPVQFGREVRTEARKITWTTRKETWITSVMVFIMVVMTAIFFLVVDWGLGQSIQALLKLVA